MEFYRTGNQNFGFFRWANAGDLPTLRQMVLQGHPSEHYLADKLNMMLNPGAIRLLLTQWQANDARIIAFSATAMSDVDPDDARLITIVVRPEIQRTGVGTRMLQDVLTQISLKSDRKYLTTLVPEYKTDGHDEEFQLPWYMKMGFTATGVVERGIYQRDGRKYDGFEFQRSIF